MSVPVPYLILGEGPRFERSPEARGDHTVPIVDTIKALDTGLWNDVRVFDGNLLLDDTMMAQLGRDDTQGLIALINEGDLMEPLIADGAPVVVDYRDTRMREGLWAYRIGHNLLIRRLRRTGIDGIDALPANVSYPPERYEGDLRQHVALIGRVLFTATSLK